jgi:hypothetical protein
MHPASTKPSILASLDGESMVNAVRETQFEKALSPRIDRADGRAIDSRRRHDENAHSSMHDNWDEDSNIILTIVLELLNADLAITLTSRLIVRSRSSPKYLMMQSPLTSTRMFRDMILK